MKNYKVKFSIFNLFRASQQEVAKLQMVWAGLMAPIVASTFVASSDRNSLIAAIIGFVIDKLICCFYFEEKIDVIK